MFDYNPPVYNSADLILMSSHDVLVAQYQLQLATVSLMYALLIFASVFAILRWALPKFWYKERV